MSRCCFRVIQNAPPRHRDAAHDLLRGNADEPARIEPRAKRNGTDVPPGWRGFGPFGSVMARHRSGDRAYAEIQKLASSRHGVEDLDGCLPRLRRPYESAGYGELRISRLRGAGPSSHARLRAAPIRSLFHLERGNGHFDRDAVFILIDNVNARARGRCGIDGKQRHHGRKEQDNESAHPRNRYIHVHQFS